MDSQSATKMDNCYESSLLDQDMLTSSEAEDNSTDQVKRRKLETNPLKISHIVEKILSFLGTNCIKNARQMDKLWSAEGAKVLITKCYVNIHKALQNDESSSTKSNKMDQFKAFLSYKSNEGTIIPNIAIGADVDIELWKSFGVLGSQVHSLKFDKSFSYCKIKAEFLGKLLDLLPNLKYFSYPDTSDVIKALTSAMSKVERAENPLVISTMSLRPCNLEQLEAMEKLSECINIKVEEFFLGFASWSSEELLENRIASMCNKFLFNSQNTIEWLYLCNCEEYLCLLEFPLMPKLTRMDLKLDQLDFDPCLRFKFSSSFRFSEKLPNLHSIVIQGPYSGDGEEAHWGEGIFEGLCKNTGTSTSVKRLEYPEYIGPSNVKHLFQIFPNLEEFVAERVLCCWATFLLLWKHGRNLKKLDITIDLDEKIGKALDKFFTGLDLRRLRLLKRHRHSVPYNTIEELRTSPSILDLQELNELRICFCWTPSKTPQKMLAITGEHAFKLMPNTKIVIDIGFYGSKPTFGAFDEVSKLTNVTLISSNIFNL